MRKTYNTLIVPQSINADRIISAFANVIDESSLEYYRNEVDMYQVDAILGFPSVIEEDDVGQMFLSGDYVGEEHIGETVWNVTDGHHRSIVASEMGISLRVELDYSCITDEVDLKRYDEVEKYNRQQEQEEVAVKCPENTEKTKTKKKATKQKMR